MDCPYCGDSELLIYDCSTTGEDQLGKFQAISVELVCNKGHFWHIVIEKYKRGVYITVGIERKVNYAEYIKSSEWKRKADQAKEDAGFRCQLCNASGTETTLHAHHRTYENLGDELPEDITVLCADCHAKFHGIHDNGK
jgi:hypothetical protein